MIGAFPIASAAVASTVPAVLSSPVPLGTSLARIGTTPAPTPARRIGSA